MNIAQIAFIAFIVFVLAVVIDGFVRAWVAEERSRNDHANNWTFTEK